MSSKLSSLVTLASGNQNTHSARIVKEVYSYMSTQFFAVPAFNPASSRYLQSGVQKAAECPAPGLSVPAPNICLVELSEDRRIAVVVLSSQGSETANAVLKG
ncbi:hypothetical protein ARMGADRAFT_1019249 [Armillaria gallica]|uniref:Uncharacterized protein n=1 Tax=Armillaria gallica TaxID=47427 RepID=A0A2H3D6H1_ARMGA|nr:hypothetical protein ARMGADRAFT_1019249 [Armillaria gallica]